jgi:hypothetical protein
MNNSTHPNVSFVVVRFAFALLIAALVAAPAQQAAPLPERLSDAEFWRLVTSISEPGGYFRIVDNFTSNENEIGYLFPQIATRAGSGNVYLGVGPEQNLTYIAAIRPAMAFIVDIRRQAVMQHLMFKAMFELSKDRTDFISMLFSKPKPTGLDPKAPIQEIWDRFDRVRTEIDIAPKNRTAVVERLTKTHEFTFTDEESQYLDKLLDAFVEYGPGITTQSGPGGRGAGGQSLTFVDLTGWSMDEKGEPQSFLSTDEHFQTVKALHEKNLIVPVSGDFAGPKAIRAIGDYLHERGAVVRAFYVSNVEQYLFQERKATAFYENVETLPLDDTSFFIRPYSLRQASPPMPLCGILKYLAAAKAGDVSNNNDANRCPQ